MDKRYAFIGNEAVGDVVRERLDAAGWTRTADVASAGMVVTYCTSQTALEDAYFDENGIVQAASPNTVLIDLSASTPSFARELNAVAIVSDLAAVEAPLVVADPMLSDALSDRDNLMCLVGGEEDDVEAARPVLDALVGTVQETGGSGSAQLARAAYTLQTSAQIMSAIEADALYRRLEELLPELEDISSEAASMAFGADDNEEREADLEDRVSAMKHACRKYNMDSDQLVDYLGECRQELSQLSGLDGEIERLSEEKHELAGQVKRMAEDISAKRREASEKLSAEICEVLRFLNMPNVTLTFDVRPDKITINGMDEVEILISANAGEEPKPLNKTASGGELSRVMLAVKSVMAEGDDIPTMIFDEVDAGISGRTAAKVGIKLAETARKRQVLCITHLAQIAALAQTHMLIEKQTDDKRTYTRIVPLDHEGRKQELARIMDGGLTESGLKAAEEMLSRQVE